ncbi:hypothetical protein KSP39_PZI006374 [Platanthera zijinensis]|uniref:Integrase catalytic domain-containing protein n=1 Tax=Platanthera zijinensis TaxID=2320716 RepID=A0AAP0BPN2_9ASPA
MQFIEKSFTKLCEELKINLRHTAVAHPHANGQIEVTNRTILKGLKTRLEEARGSGSMRSPTEAVIPVDIGVPSTRVKTFDVDKNEDLLRENLDLLAEVRDTSALRVADYLRRVARFYDRRVKPRPINVRDLVLRSLEAVGKGPQQNKLIAAWDASYVVTAVVKSGTFKIRNAEGKTLPRTWNAQNLRRFYHKHVRRTYHPSDAPEARIVCSSRQSGIHRDATPLGGSESIIVQWHDQAKEKTKQLISLHLYVVIATSLTPKTCRIDLEFVP